MEMAAKSKRARGGLKVKFPIASEHVEQVNLFRWVEWERHKHPELEGLFAIPNGGDRNRVVGGKLKAEGVRAGVPDLFLPAARGKFHGLFIEMKRSDGGAGLTDEQKTWAAWLRSQGYQVVTCNGCDEAMATLLKYLGQGPE